ncbi:hypothetical protein SmJEL517_g03364 [Synchytrium microbalum]|uniref:Glucose-methanol-choline oxidoreductase N-terminal domain-containing protein n=1 Tax=Synchytrium microbalum TaxID=1806994 RepID=A0A507C2G9_9FUNG|nr:uncharacterized protein SmJEL517_g03364 [Synchytrium microbalum]TPX33922.1 hypothetical protein SmJEL517_g03364 [Synchytrium microbalum]
MKKTSLLRKAVRRAIIGPAAPKKTFSNSPFTIGVENGCQEFDYVIVGGGSAGCIIAARLAEDENVTVCLIEAGADHKDKPAVNVPGMALLTWNSQIDWGYTTKDQKELRSRPAYWPRGKVLGGSGSINAMIYARCSPEDFNEWERDFGLIGWGWSNMQEYYKKFESYEISKKEIDADEHGYEGPVQISRTGNGNVHPLALDWVASASELGVGHGPNGTCAVEEPHKPICRLGDDYNGVKEFGTGVTHTTIFDGKRVTTATAYIHPMLDPRSKKYRPNFTLITEYQVSKILLDDSSALECKAVGVTVTRGPGCPKSVIYAKREVIVCAGAVGSPHLLMLSGIGAKAELEAAQITCRVDLPGVGKNLQDHLFAAIPFISKIPVYKHDPKTLVAGLHHYTWHRSGVLASSFVQAVSFFSSQSYVDRVSSVEGRTRAPPPNLQIHFAPSTSENLWLEKTKINTAKPVPLGPLKDDDIFDEEAHKLKSFSINPPKKYPNVISPMASLLKPQSVGTISIKSKSAWVAPEIQPNYLSHPDDLEDMVDCAMEVRRIVEQMRKMKRARVGEEYADEAVVEEIMRAHKLNREDAIKSRDYLREIIRRNAVTIFHPVGTCKMAADSDPMGVVDRECRVRGVLSLRVIDASVFPRVTAGNTAAPVMAVAERMADIIKGCPV